MFSVFYMHTHDDATYQFYIEICPWYTIRLFIITTVKDQERKNRGVEIHL